MRRIVFFLLMLAIVGLIFTGAIRLQRTDESITIHINKRQVKEDAGDAIDGAKDVLGDVREAWREDGEWR